MYKEKYVKYKMKYLKLKQKMQKGGMLSHRIMYDRFKDLSLSPDVISLFLNEPKNEEDKQKLSNAMMIVNDFKSKFYNDSGEGLPILVETNPDKYQLVQIDPKESEVNKENIRKVHLLYQAFLTGNGTLFQIINHYWSKFRNPPSILEIWEKNLQKNYKNSYDFVYDGIKILSKSLYDRAFYTAFYEMLFHRIIHFIKDDTFYINNRNLQIAYKDLKEQDEYVENKRKILENLRDSFPYIDQK